MSPKNHSGQLECRSRAGPLGAHTLVRAAMVIAPGLVLASCVGSYENGYGNPRTQYQASPSYETRYDQRRGSDYGHSGYGSPDQEHGTYSWWEDAKYSRDRRDYRR
jgi:hypothetical protein